MKKRLAYLYWVAITAVMAAPSMLLAATGDYATMLDQVATGVADIKAIVLWVAGLMIGAFVVIAVYRWAKKVLGK